MGLLYLYIYLIVQGEHENSVSGTSGSTNIETQVPLRIVCEVMRAQHVVCDTKRIFDVMMCASGVQDLGSLAASVRACSGYQLHGRATSGRLQPVQ
jgi:hypothetical protein